MVSYFCILKRYELLCHDEGSCEGETLLASLALARTPCQSWLSNLVYATVMYP